MPRVIVVGAGVAGLTAAWRLKQAGIDVQVLESSERLGGKLLTERVGDLLIDAGPDSFLSSKPAALALIGELGLDESVIDTLPDGGGTFILHDGRLEPLPEGMTLLVPADPRAIIQTRLLSPLGKARLLAEYAVRPHAGEDDESVGAFMRRRVGREAFERLAEPLLSGIYAGDADQLSLASTYPRFRAIEREHGGLIRGAMAMRRAVSSSAPRTHTPFVSLRDGVGQLIDALAASIGRQNITTNAPVTAIVRAGDRYRVETTDQRIDVDGVVVATPASDAARMLDGLDSTLATELTGIPYVTSATISLGFAARDVERHQHGRGFVIPRREGRMLTAVTWTSNKFGGRVPEGTALLRGFVGRSGHEAPALLPDDELVDAVRRELLDILGIAAEPTLARVYRWSQAMPQYNLGHADRLARIDRQLAEHPALRLTGAAYRGVGIPDCIADATRQAGAVANTLGVTSPVQDAPKSTTSA